MKYHNPGRIKFTAKLKDAGGGGVFVFFPFDAQKLFGTKGRVPIKATFNGEPYRGSLVNMGDGPVLIVVKAIREKINKLPGDMVEVTVELDEDSRIAEVPNDLDEKLSSDMGVKEAFSKLSYSHQKEYVDWLNEAKKPDTRIRRLNKIIDMLNEG